MSFKVKEGIIILDEQKKIYVLHGHWSINDEWVGEKIFGISYNEENLKDMIHDIYNGHFEPWIEENFLMKNVDFCDTHLEIKTNDYRDYINIYITEEDVI